MSEYLHQLSPETVTAAIHTALREQKRGNIEGARTLLRGLTLSQPDDPRIWLVLATVAETREEQRQALERVAELSPDHPLAQRTLARFQSTEPKVSDPVTHSPNAAPYLSSAPRAVSERFSDPSPAPADARNLSDATPPRMTDYAAATYQEGAPQTAPNLEFETKGAPDLATQIRWPLYMVIGVAVLLAFAASIVVQSSYGQQDARSTPSLPGAVSSAPTSDAVVNPPATTERNSSVQTPEPGVQAAYTPVTSDTTLYPTTVNVVVGDTNTDATFAATAEATDVPEEGFPFGQLIAYDTWKAGLLRSSDAVILDGPIGSLEPSGQFVAALVMVNNASATEAQIPIDLFILEDSAGNRYLPNVEASAYYMQVYGRNSGDMSMASSIPGGVNVSVPVLFDVPKDAEGLCLLVRDGDFGWPIGWSLVDSQELSEVTPAP